jgi:signal transduction histidine kinase
MGMPMAVEAELRRALERADRRRRSIMRVLPYVLLAISLVFTLLQALVDPGVNVAMVLVLTGAAAATIHVFGGHPHWHERGAARGAYFTTVVALTGGLVAASPWYGFFAFMGYVLAETQLRGRWRYVGVAATAVVTSAAYLGGYDGLASDQAWLAWPPVALVVAVLAGAFLRFAEQEDKRVMWQRQSLDELHAANAQLEEALQDNAALHAQLLVQAREAGVQDERQRMAREIHDTLAQGLAGILAQLQAAEQTLRVGAPERRQVTAAIALARESLAEARRTVHAVEPQVLADYRLPEAIQSAVSRWSEETGTEALLTTTGHPHPLHTDVEVTLLRIAQEALANVAKHAQAGRVVITLSYMQDAVTLDVMDDGVGFVTTVPAARAGRGQTAPDGGFGLTGMRQRVQRLAGRLEVESEPGGGTAISASLPAIPAGEDAA